MPAYFMPVFEWVKNGSILINFGSFLLTILQMHYTNLVM